MAKQILKPCPLTLQGVSVLACMTAWGLPALYKLTDIYAATPGVTYDLEAYRIAMGPPISGVATYWASGYVGSAQGFYILAARLRQLGKLTGDQFPHTPARLEADYAANLKAIREYVNSLQVSNTWAGLRSRLADDFEYSGPVAVPVWDAPEAYA